MRKMLAILIAFISTQIFAQIPAQNSMRSETSIISIPVVFHIIYHVEVQNIPDERIFEQLDRLNMDYRRTNADTVNTPEAFEEFAADCEIEFCLAQRDPDGNPTTGIVRVETDVTSWELELSDQENVKYSADGGDDAWPADKYLNIWVCNLGSGLLGYATVPGGDAELDGVVLSYKYVGNDLETLPYNLGRTATHEIGHWLNLLHPGASADCSADDLVDDTPLESAYVMGCPDFPVLDACTPDYPGIMFMNFMEMREDACLNLFTEGQKNRMRELFEPGGLRYSLTYSDACLAPVGIDPQNQSTEIKIFPNPVHDNLNLTFDAAGNSKIEIVIYNISGEKIISQESTVTDGKNKIEIDCSDFDSGCYFLSIRSSEFITSLPFTLVRMNAP